MTLQELVCELNFELKPSNKELAKKKCYEVIRKQVPGASKMTNLQLLLLATVVSSTSEFQEKIAVEFQTPVEY